MKNLLYFQEFVYSFIIINPHHFPLPPLLLSPLLQSYRNIFSQATKKKIKTLKYLWNSFFLFHYFVTLRLPHSSLDLIIRWFFIKQQEEEKKNRFLLFFILFWFFFSFLFFLVGKINEKRKEKSNNNEEKTFCYFKIKKTDKIACLIFCYFRIRENSFSISVVSSSVGSRTLFHLTNTECC